MSPAAAASRGARAKKSTSVKKNTNKTQLTDDSVEEYLSAITDEARRKDCQALTKLMAGVTRQPPRMWGKSIVGFGSYHYKYDSGREGDMCLVGFSSRADSISLYVVADTPAQLKLLAKLGKHKSAKACVYIKRLADVDAAVLKAVVAASVAEVKRRHG
jgi:hypothetical protein